MATARVRPKGWRPELTAGDRLRLLRRDYSIITGERLGVREFAQVLSIPWSTYAAWEADRRQPPPPVYSRIAEVTGVDPDWLRYGDEPGPVPNANANDRRGRKTASTRWRVMPSPLPRSSRGLSILQNAKTAGAKAA